MPTQPLVRQGETISNVMDGLKQLEEKFEAAEDTWSRCVCWMNPLPKLPKPEFPTLKSRMSLGELLRFGAKWLWYYDARHHMNHMLLYVIFCYIICCYILLPFQATHTALSCIRTGLSHFYSQWITSFLSHQAMSLSWWCCWGGFLGLLVTRFQPMCGEDAYFSLTYFFIDDLKTT